MFHLCSAWFADAAWAQLGLPAAWLHPLYQAVLAPLRLMWHLWPNYKVAYTAFEEQCDLLHTVPGFFGLVAIVSRASSSMLAEALAATLPALAVTAALAVGIFKAAGSAHGGEWQQANQPLFIGHLYPGVSWPSCLCLARALHGMNLCLAVVTWLALRMSPNTIQGCLTPSIAV